MSFFAVQVAKKGKSIEIQRRALEDDLDDVETATFTTVANGSVKAIVCTPNGKEVFDGVNTDESVTHEFHLVWPGFDVTVENWVLLKSKRYRILLAKNCCEADQRVVLQCTERGVTTRAASDA